MRNSVKADWAFPWETLSLPVLNVTGHCDRVFLDGEVLDRVTAGMADVRRLDWQDCGHLIPLERPERLAGALAEFGAEVERGA
jgi:pimeloyl-ACP methyl ester carboxylesterase